MVYNITKRIKNIIGIFCVTCHKEQIKNKIRSLEEQLITLREQCRNRQSENEPPIIIEQLYVDKIMVDKVELVNNIGTLGIKELSGILNIGANYGGKAPSNLDKEKEKVPEKPGRKPQRPCPKKDGGPKYSINFQPKT